MRDFLARRAAYLLPRRVVYWALIRAAIRTIDDHEEVPAVPATVVLERWGRLTR